MGIADLWPVLNVATPRRVPFVVFVSEFYNKYGRPPRLAIDAYMFMFWSQLLTLEVPDKAVQQRILRNFMAKLWFFVQVNVLFVVVFDGKYKPGKLRHSYIPEIPESLSYDETLQYFRGISASAYSENNGLVESLKKILQRNRIDWVQAPSEAEAECAWLQRLNVVDYVVSDDSDALVFGATRVLRSFNRVKFYDEENKPVLSSTDYYVTPFEMNEVTRTTGLTRDRLVFIAVLRGGDYSNGSEGIGIIRAKELALCGTTMLLVSPRKKAQDFGSFPDFSETFVNCFMDCDKKLHVLADPYYGMKEELDRAESLPAFTTHLNEYLGREAKNIFGRATQLKETIKIIDFYAMMYFFPFVSRTVFKFTPFSISFGELEHVASDLGVTVPGRFARTNVVFGPGVLGYLNIDEDGKINFDSSHQLRSNKYVLPGERKYNLRPFTLKLLAEQRFWKRIKFIRSKVLEGVKLAVLQFERIALNEAVYCRLGSTFKEVEEEPGQDLEEEFFGDLKEVTKTENTTEGPEEQDSEKLLTVIVPLEALNYVSERYARDCLTLPRKSPKKRYSPQKRTLDSIWSVRNLPFKTHKTVENFTELAEGEISVLNHKEVFKMEEPESPFLVKNLKSKENESLQIKDIGLKFERTRSVPVLLRSLSPTLSPLRNARGRSSLRNNKNALLPGQSTLTSFFQLCKPLSNHSQDYRELQQEFRRLPSLSVDLDSSPETSPSKRVKNEQQKLLLAFQSDAGRF